MPIELHACWRYDWDLDITSLAMTYLDSIALCVLDFNLNFSKYFCFWYVQPIGSPNLPNSVGKVEEKKFPNPIQARPLFFHEWNGSKNTNPWKPFAIGHNLNLFSKFILPIFSLFVCLDKNCITNMISYISTKSEKASFSYNSLCEKI